MSGLKLFTSNRLEILADQLAKVLAVPLASPLAAEVIIVQSRGMERWLSLEIARLQGICANIRFPFPKAFVEESFVAVLGGATVAETFTPDVMTWKVMKLLPSFLDHPGFEQIRRYLKRKTSPLPVLAGENDADSQSGDAEDGLPVAVNALKRFQLAERIARLFDQYLIFRPEMMTAWEKGKTVRDDEIWQCELWRALIAGEVASHPAALKEAFIREIGLPQGAFDLPERLFVFGISALPRFHLEVFHALSQKIEVNLFLMNPSREFWGDIRSDRERDWTVERVREAGGEYDFSREGLYLERGNRLLASCGTLGREFFSLTLGFSGEERDFFEDPGEDELLSAVQSDILNLRDRGTEAKKVIDLDDRSIRFHSCHSPMREIEVLYDNLLSLFEEDDTLLPRDILVMAPDIEIYAPLIKALFDRPKGSESADSLPRIPFTIADRKSLAETSVIEGFMEVLDMAGGRFGAGQVLSLLEIPETGNRFGITTADSEVIRRWVRETGIRWGIDPENRRRLGLPALKENTWQEGLERLLMGYAMPGKDFKLVGGILPYDLEGSDTALLGRFLEYAEAVFSFATSVATMRTLSDWSRFLEDLLDGLFSAQENGRAGIDQLRSDLLRLQELEGVSGFQEQVDVSVIKSWLSMIFEEKGFGYGFLAGGVTFCSMLPMRSIPCKVICLLGMNGADYPRRSWAAAFDLMARHPQPADRSKRKDDRYLFLEALLSARKRMIISYVGQNSEDNSLLPPSVLVTELLDYLEEGFVLPGGDDIKEHLVVRHRLQAFSPAYFHGEDGLFSYSGENWRAAHCIIERKEALPLVPPVIPMPDDTWRNVDIADLVNFFADPVRFFFQRRLDVRTESGSGLPEEKEPFQLAGLDKYDLGQALAETGLAGRELQEYHKVALASGRLPHGAMGISSYQSLQGEVRGFVERVRPLLADKEPSTLNLDMTIGGFRLRGNILLYARGLVHFRHAGLKIKDHLRLWISHAALNMLADTAPSAPAILLGRDKTWRYAPPADGEKILTALLEVYWEGLSKPMKFFPLASWEYGKAVFHNKKSREEGLKAALKVWRGDDFSPGEAENPFYCHCFGDSEPLDEEFEKAAETILGPIFYFGEEIQDGEV